ncbi:MAG: molybdopterin-dependent oxidoreductase [Chloroflexota bacterium]
MEAVTITLDGLEVSGYLGMTILELAQESGVPIPTLCHDPNLAPFGACRVCLVEDERSAKLLAACVTPISPGMVISTRSPRVLERRRVIVKLMLASHPDSCMVCDKGNRCHLRQVAAEMGIGLVDFERIPQRGAIEEVNPFIERDLSKCVLCAKCIRADHELVVEGAIDYINRGAAARPATLNDLPLEQSECTFCGICVALCPTGALMEKECSYRGTTATTVATVCPFCGCGCRLSLEVKDGRLVRARPAADSPVNGATLCVRGGYGYDFVHSPERLDTPLVKTDGEFQPVSWEAAMERIATEFERIKKARAGALAVLGSARSTNEEHYLLQRLARGVLGTNNVDNGSRLYSSASWLGLGRSLGFPGTTGSLDGLEQSPVIMVIGADPPTSAPVVGYAVKRAVKYGGARLLLVDPRRTRLSGFAHLWLRPGPGTDLALINGLAKVIIDEKLFDEEFVARRADGFAELAGCLEGYTAGRVAKITGVSAADIRLAARLFASAERASIVYGNGITQQVNGTASVMALANLAMLTGNSGSGGGGIFALQRANNAQGACDLGVLPDFLPGYQDIADAGVSDSFEKRWGVSLPVGKGLTAWEMMAGAKEGRVKGMLIMGEDVVSSFPAPGLVKEALASLDFLVVADLFLTETARLATVVLPSASFAEKEGTFTNFEGRLQEVHKAIEPIGGSLPDGEIILRLADRMGFSLPYDSPQQVMDEIKELVPLYRQLSPADSVDGLKGGSPGARRLYRGLFPSGFERFSPLEYTPSPDGASDDYPLTLQWGSILYHFGNGSRTLRSSRLNRFSPEAFVEIGEADAEKMGITAGEMVRVISPAGEGTAGARLTDTLPPGMLFMPLSFAQSQANGLFSAVLDPQAGTPALKSCAVRLERVGADG